MLTYICDRERQIQDLIPGGDSGPSSRTTLFLSDYGLPYVTLI